MNSESRKATVKASRKKLLVIIAFLVNGVIAIISVSCEQTESREARLAKQYCGSCHMMPDPALLDKNTWMNSVLPQMKFRMGYEDRKIWSSIPHNDRATVYQTLPAEPMISEEDWQRIVDYYVANAPDTLTVPPLSPLQGLTQFDIASFSHVPPFITMLKHDERAGRTYVGNSFSRLHVLDKDFTKVDSMTLASPPSHIVFDRDGFTISLMGIMHPNDQAKGELIEVRQGSPVAVKPILDSLKRPVFFARHDLNGDQVDELIVCNFGNYTGALVIYESGQQKPRILNALPGARQVIVEDFNQDGASDILVLMAQGDERIILYKNKGNLMFEEETLLRFPPVYGSMYFEVHDFNHDGYFDILYANGDNGDFSIVKKGYHAVRIFQNNGKNEFSEIWSFPFPGACQAIGRDFDLDGDIDIAAISFFPDYKKNEPGFIYFENTGRNRFTPTSTASSQEGRWMIMEAADVDDDGDDDIILGALSVRGLGAGQEDVDQWMKKKTSILLLRNKLH